jgi:hypothetical protein
MLRRIAVLAVLALAAAAVVDGTAGGEKKSDAPGAKKANYVHSVIFYLKKDAPEGEVGKLIEDSHKLLAKIPTVRHLSVGRPAEKATPKYAITDFSVGLLVFFDDYDGLQKYLDHPLHAEYLEKHGKYWEKVPVYDFVNQMK